MVAGGGVLAWMGFSMLSGQATSTALGNAPANSGASLTPLVLFAASPGTITGVITRSAAHTGVGSSSHGSCGNRGRRSCDVAGLVSRLTGRRQGQRGRGCTGYGPAFHGVLSCCRWGCRSPSPGCTNSGYDYASAIVSPWLSSISIGRSPILLILGRQGPHKKINCCQNDALVCPSRW